MNLIGDEMQTEKQRKTKRTMMIIIIALVILLVIAIILVVAIYNYQTKVLKLRVDNQNQNISNGLFIFEGEDVYVPIRDFASYVGYSSYNGDYKQYVEDTTKCYVQSTNEVASFSLNSNKIYKTILDGQNDYEYFTIDKPVKMINGKLCTTLEGLRVAFNLSISYDRDRNTIQVSTLPYLVQYYTTRFQDPSISDSNAAFSNKKALLYGMVVLRNESNKYGVYTLDGNEIIGAKYDNIKFIESSMEFIVTTEERKMGILSYDSTTKIQPQYDEIKQLDKDSNLYLVKNDGKQGIVNNRGEIVLYLEYDQIGVDANRFAGNDIKNQYLLYNNCIPVKKDQKWGIYDIHGRELVKIQYDDLGCSRSSGSNGSTNSILLIPEYEGIVLKQNEMYGIVSSNGKEILPAVLESVYSVTSAGQQVYYMIYNNQVINLLDYLDKYVKKEELFSDESTTDTSNNNNTIEEPQTNEQTQNQVSNEVVENQITNEIVNETNNQLANQTGNASSNTTNNTTAGNSNTVAQNATN